MAASDALNQDLFIRVYHASRFIDPPHTTTGSVYPLHAGTLDAAYERGRVAGDTRRYIHAYDVPKSMIRPELWADPHRDYKDYIDKDTGYSTGGNYTEEQTLKHRIPKQPELWESVPVTMHGPMPGKVFQYRNDHEDPGSISYMINTRNIMNENSFAIQSSMSRWGRKIFNENQNDPNYWINKRRPIRYRGLTIAN